ncbi:MAG: cobyric acid synthase CobQ, partial [Lachnospira sp.]|nr:cobyric acid synthase CobQ [Lachnospira sp.]
SVRYVSNVRQLGRPDLVVLPGSKNTSADLAWMRQEGLADAVCRLAGDGAPVLGICGGFQMRGEWVADPERVEVLTGQADTVRGLGLLPCRTVLKGTKTTRQVRGVIPETEGAMAMLSGKPFEGYEIHMGETVGPDGAPVTFFSSGNVLGTYVHGLFDKKEPAAALVSLLRAVAGKPDAAGAPPVRVQDLRRFRQSQYDRLADTLEQCLDIRAIEALFKKASV